VNIFSRVNEGAMRSRTIAGRVHRSAGRRGRPSSAWSRCLGEHDERVRGRVFGVLGNAGALENTVGCSCARGYGTTST
jgi:hypothetical protein